MVGTSVFSVIFAIIAVLALALALLWPDPSDGELIDVLHPPVFTVMSRKQEAFTPQCQE